MIQFDQSSERWWQKPLVKFQGRELPAELVILRLEIGAGESGAWLNSRGTKSGTVDLIRVAAGRFRSERASLPGFVQAKLRDLYDRTGLSKGAPDLVIWKPATETVRFVEVKCPHWDRPSSEQLEFHVAAEAAGSPVAIVEWEFGPTAPAA